MESRGVHNVVYYLSRQAGLEKEQLRRSKAKKREIKRQILSALDTDAAAEKLLNLIERECL